MYTVKLRNDLQRPKGWPEYIPVTSAAAQPINFNGSVELGYMVALDRLQAPTLAAIIHGIADRFKADPHEVAANIQAVGLPIRMSVVDSAGAVPLS